MSSARAWPPPPTVASSTTPTGTAEKISTTSSSMTGCVLERPARSVVVGFTVRGGLTVSRICRAHTQPLGQHCAGFSLSVHRTGRVEKGTPVLLVKGLRISPFKGRNGHTAPPPVGGPRRVEGWGRRTTGSCHWRGCRTPATIRSRQSSACQSSTRFRAPITITGLSGSRPAYSRRVARDGDPPLGVELHLCREGAQNPGQMATFAPPVSPSSSARARYWSNCSGWPHSKAPSMIGGDVGFLRVELVAQSAPAGSGVPLRRGSTRNCHGIAPLACSHAP